MPAASFPILPPDWEPTRATLHAYANGVSVIPRAHAVASDRWYHISLKPVPAGLVTESMGLPGGGSFHIRMDFARHAAVIETAIAEVEAVSMSAGLTATEFGDALIAVVASLGLQGDYVRQKFESDEPRDYDPAAASTFFAALAAIADTFEQHRSSLEGDVGPLQLWPHGFDLAFEWYGTRIETYGDEEHPSQLNLGWYPAGDAYFYSNPWPFEADALMGAPLPHGAVWHTDGWEGTMLGYSELAGEADAAQKLLDFARAVHDVAAPTLMA
jgi:hypothetical protein